MSTIGRGSFHADPSLDTGRDANVALAGVSGLPGRALAALDRMCLRAIAVALAGVPMRLALWNGASVATAAGPPEATVLIRDRATLVRLVFSPDLAFGEAYSEGRLDVDGDLVRFLEQVARRVVASRRSGGLATWLARRGGNAIGRARRNVHHHYDIGNDFYRLWLDAEMVYTCAYFPEPAASLEDAQVAKMEHVARKLDLRPGETVFEAGCGWGSLALYLAREHHVAVRACNVSGSQIAWARERAKREGLEDRVEFIEDDYRNLRGRCDAFVSVGMLEHVGRRDYATLGEVIDRCLHPGHGRGLLHFIGRNAPAPMAPWIARHIFPGAYIPSLGEAIDGVLEPFGLSALDVENLRLHYARTLEHWLERFDRAAAGVRAMFDRRFERMWRLYLAEAQAGFLAGNLQLFQVTFARASNNRVPWTRDRLYR